MAAQELLSMKLLLGEITNNLNKAFTPPLIPCTLFEDRIGAETLATTPKLNTYTKHICIKYHHFRATVKKKILLIEQVETKEQLAGIFTKATQKETFTHLRKGIMGWLASNVKKINETSY